MEIAKADRKGTGLAKPRANSRRAADTKLEILAAAAQLFAEKGYSECNLRELADKVGMKAGSFYYHFRSKEEILDELLDRSISLVHYAVTGAIEALGSDAPVRDRIAAAIRAHITTFLDNDGNSSAFMRVWEHLPPTMKRRNREKRRAYAAIWYGLMEDGIRDGVVRKDVDLKLMVPFVIAGMSRTIEWYNPRHMTIEQICDAVRRIHLDGGILADKA